MIEWQPIELVDKSKTILAKCPSYTTPSGFVYPEYIAIAHWWEGDSLNEPCWVTASLKCYPSHFIYYKDLLNL